MIVDRNSI